MSRWRGWAPAVAGAAGAVSLAASVGMLLAGAAYERGGATAGQAFAEAGLLLVLGAVAVRVAPAGPWLFTAALPLVAVPAWLLRFGSQPLSAATVGGFVGWGFLALVAAAVGSYLRRLDAARIRSVTGARRAQRLQLARDLHDFVAHDVSGMLAQAQAGQFLTERDPAAATAAFRRIETAGLQALASLDRTVHMLRDPDEEPHGGPAVRPATLDDLPDLVARFASTADISLEIGPGLAAALPREHAATAYRVIVEALTNVRRHAPGAARVAVRVHRAGPAVLVSVTDDGPAAAAARSARPKRRGGLGLPGLAERVEALGGTLTAGPAAANGADRPAGWRLAATLPLGTGADP